MTTAGKPKPRKRFGTFGEPDRELTQVEREFYTNLARIRKKRTRKKEKPPAESEHRRGKEKRGTESEMSKEKFTDKLLSLRKRSLTPANAASRSTLPAPSSPPRDNRLAVLSAVGLPDRTAPLVWEPDRHKARDRAASECVSSCAQHMPEPRRGFGFNDYQHAPESLCKPGDSILLPSRYQSARSGHESTPRRQRPRRAPNGPLTSAANSPDRTPDVPLEIGLLEKLQRMKVLSAPQTSAREFSKRGNSNPSSVMSGGGAGENVDLSRVDDFSDDKADVEGRSDRALSALHREYFSSGSFHIHGLTDEQKPTLEVLVAIEKLLTLRKESTTSTRADPTTKQASKEAAATQKRGDHGNVHSAPMPKPKATAPAGKGSQARAASFPSMIGSTIQAAAAATTPARTSPPLSRAEAMCAAASPPLAQPLPSLHTNAAGRHAQKSASGTRRQASCQPSACVSGRSRGANSSRSRQGGFLNPFCCTNGTALRNGLAEKTGRQAAQGALRKDAYTQTRPASGATAVDEACRQYVEQCHREEQELKKMIESERQRAGTAPRKASAAFSAALSGTATDADSAVAASSSPTKKVVGGSAFSHHRLTSAAISGASTEERVSPRSSFADRTKRKCDPACRTGRLTPLSCTDLNHLNTSKSTRKRSGSPSPAHAYPFLAGVAEDACDSSSKCTPSAQPKIAFAGAGGGGGVSPNKTTRMTAVTLPTPMREAGGSRSRPFQHHLQDPDNVASFTAALSYEPSSAEESQMSSRAISVVDISSTVSHCGTSESVSVAEETVQMVKAHTTEGSPQMNTLHKNAGARSDPARQRANSVGVATEPPSSPSAQQRESRQSVLSGAPVHTPSFDGSGIGVTTDDAYEAGSDLYVFRSY